MGASASSVSRMWDALLCPVGECTLYYVVMTCFKRIFLLDFYKFGMKYATRNTFAVVVIVLHNVFELKRKKSTTQTDNKRVRMMNVRRVFKNVISTSKYFSNNFSSVPCLGSKRRQRKVHEIRGLGQSSKRRSSRVRRTQSSVFDKNLKFSRYRLSNYVRAQRMFRLRSRTTYTRINVINNANGCMCFGLLRWAHKGNVGKYFSGVRWVRSRPPCRVLYRPSSVSL